ncbi:cytochrome P450 [Actinokineospora sp. NBRC 105648]|uniref:cytochrome P450 n=1 Tax=Actinokineospora sp. NBRC 105648 TaxID=3032206 RepID=UPI0024A12458|nr:cytochrome P450 [Actinokineospora sp. NBRC 105648]GLZ38374.1 cytochrome P450 [Actinokineospora sp. NBRC 105648]
MRADEPDPYPAYARLVAERPFGLDDTGLWIAASAAAVEAVLTAPAGRVRPAAEPVPRGIVGTPAGAVFGGLARMTDGAPQARLKSALLKALGTVDAARVEALAHTAAHAARTADELQFDVPARVVATLLGLDAGQSAEAAALIGDFVRCIPATATTQDNTAAAAAAEKLLGLLGPHLRDDSDSLLGALVRAAGAAESPLLPANAVGLLSQTFDATAGLIGNTLLALAREPEPDDLTAFVTEVARHDAPIQNTRRFTAEDTDVLGHHLPAGSAVLVLLAAANRDPAANPDPHVFRPGRERTKIYTFGLGAHRCPGQVLATAIAVGVVRAVRERGATAVLETYRPSANARIPVLRTG